MSVQPYRKHFRLELRTMSSLHCSAPTFGRSEPIRRQARDPDGRAVSPAAELRSALRSAAEQLSAVNQDWEDSINGNMTLGFSVESVFVPPSDPDT